VIRRSGRVGGQLSKRPQVINIEAADRFQLDDDGVGLNQDCQDLRLIATLGSLQVGSPRGPPTPSLDCSRRTNSKSPSLGTWPLTGCMTTFLMSFRRSRSVSRLCLKYFSSDFRSALSITCQFAKMMSFSSSKVV